MILSVFDTDSFSLTSSFTIDQSFTSNPTVLYSQKTQSSTTLLAMCSSQDSSSLSLDNLTFDLGTATTTATMTSVTTVG